MAKSKEERIYDEFFNKQRKEEYRNRNKDPMELALAEQRAAHTVMYEEPVRQEDNSTISWDEASQIYQETLKNQPVAEETVVTQPQVEQEKEPEMIAHEIPGKGIIQEKKLENGSSEFVYLDENGKMFCYETDRGLHFFAHDAEGRSMGSVDYFDNEFTKAEFVTPEGKEIEFSATEDHQLDLSKMGEEEVSAWNTLSAELAKLTEQRSDFFNQWKMMEQQKENVANQEDEFVIESVEEPVVENVIEPGQSVEEPVVENVVEPEQLVEEPVVENVVEPEEVEGTFGGVGEDEHIDEKQDGFVNVPGGQVVENPYPASQLVDEEDDEHTGSFGIGGAEPEEDDEHKDDSEKDVLTETYLGGPEKLQRWLKTYAIEGSLSQPQVASPFAGISSVKDVKGYTCKSVSMETGNKMFVGRHRIDYSNNKQKAPTLQEALTMVRMGQMNGWTSCRLKGSSEMNKQLFIACQILGMPVKDFVPTEEMIKAANDASERYNPTIPKYTEKEWNEMDSEAQKNALENIDKITKSRLLNRVADLDRRFDVVDSYAKEKEPSFESVRAAHADGYGPFNAKDVQLQKDVQNTKGVDSSQENGLNEVSQTQTAPKSLQQRMVDDLYLKTLDGKYNETQASGIAMLYNGYYKEAESYLGKLSEDQAQERQNLEQDMSGKMHQKWNEIEEKLEKGDSLSKEEEKIICLRDACRADSLKKGVESFDSVQVPRKFWSEDVEKEAVESGRGITLRYMYATEQTKANLVSVMEKAVKSPEDLKKRDEIQIVAAVPETLDDIPGKNPSKKLQKIGDIRSDNIANEEKYQKQFAKMTKGKQLTSVTGKYQSKSAQESSNQFNNQVEKKLGRYVFKNVTDRTY
ncbi:MAG: hypothetical protein MJ250_04740 [Alphaproteobacteria bacterium]|nr:hypothetical protein [Alphaproteobacteria bacterium]